MSLESAAPGDRVTTERHGRVLVIRMRRESKRNAIDPSMTTALDDALNLLEDDAELWCGVLSGGPTLFSAGTDLALGSGPPTPRGGPYGVIRRSRGTPLIAAVEGIALGGGFELALACDLIVAGEGATFGLPEVARGVVPAYGGLFRGGQFMPLPMAKQLVLTGRPLSASRAHQIGMVNELVPDGGAERGALALAEQICTNSPDAVAASLTAMESVLTGAEGPGWAATNDAVEHVLASDNHAEGVAAFLAKRAPQWSAARPITPATPAPTVPRSTT